MECLDRPYRSGYIGRLATGPGLCFFMREQLGKAISLAGGREFLALTLFHHLIGGFRNSDLRQQVADPLGVDVADYTSNQIL